METENKGLIDVRDCPCDGCKAKPCGHPARCVKFTLWLNKTVDAVEVVHGRWETPAIHIWRCSVCKICVPYSFTGDSYCHNCGAKMDFQSNVPMADAEIDFDYEAED